MRKGAGPLCRTVGRVRRFRHPATSLMRRARKQLERDEFIKMIVKGGFVHFGHV